jgi:YD repeat-containing protein
MNKLTSQTDADGKTTKFTYDLMGNQITITSPTGKVQAFTYDIASCLKEMKQQNDSRIAYDYDKLNQLIDKHATVDKMIQGPTLISEDGTINDIMGAAGVTQPTPTMQQVNEQT